MAHKRFVATPALTPALSPRRGRIIRRLSAPSRIQLVRAPFWSNCQNPVTVSAPPESPHPPKRSSLSPGERARVRASGTQISISKKHRTSNIEHRTSNAQRLPRVNSGCWMLDVECWMFPRCSPKRGRILRHGLSQRQPSVLRQFSPVNHPPAATGNSTPESSQRARSLSPLPGGEGQGEGERHPKLGLKFVRGMIVRGMKSQPKECCLPIPLTIIPLTKIPLP